VNERIEELSNVDASRLEIVCECADRECAAWIGIRSDD
jgi:hypothetical protein